MSFPRTFFSASCVLAGVLALVPGCGGGGSEPTGPRLVVLYSTCTLNKEFLSPYAGTEEVGYTPHFQRFADAGLVFERHNSEAGQSGIAFASIYTGVQADRHGVYFHPDTIAPELIDLTEAFLANGYQPHSWSGQPMASAEYGYAQAVPEARTHHTHVKFTKRAKPLPAGFLEATTANTPEFDAVLQGLVDDHDSGAFVQINNTITHELYHEYADLATIEAFRRDHPEHATDLSSQEIAKTLRFFETHRHDLQLNHDETVARLELSEADVARLDQVLQLAYKACVHQLDGLFGQFLDRIDAAGLANDSLIVLTADHGETFYHESEPFHWMHGMQLAPSVIEVPLIVRGPAAGVPVGRYEEVTRSIDVYPTMIGLCDGRLPSGYAVDGVDLTAGIRGAPRKALHAYSHTTTIGETRLERYRKEGRTRAVEVLPAPEPEYMWVRVRDGDLVWEIRQLVGGRPETVAFDLATDRRRTKDVYDPADPHHAKMVARLEAYRKGLIDAYDPAELGTKEMLEKLEGLGYLGGD